MSWKPSAALKHRSTSASRACVRSSSELTGLLLCQRASARAPPGDERAASVQHEPGDPLGAVPGQREGPGAADRGAGQVPALDAQFAADALQSLRNERLV